MAVKIQHYDIGDLWTPQATWTVGGSPTDPTQIVVKQQDADGVETTITTASSPGSLTSASTPLARMSAGVFKLNPGISLTKQGYWYTRFEGTGAAAATEEQQAIVDPSEFFSNGGINTRALVGLAETKDWLQQQNIDTSSDLELIRVINDISDRFYEESEREFKNFDNTSSATIRFFPPNDYNRMDIGDLSTTPILVRILDRDGNLKQSVPAADVVSHPRVRRPWQPITHLQFTVDVICPWWDDQIEVTGVWGFPSVPGNVRQAVMDAVAQVMNRDVEHYSQDLGPATAGEGQNVVVFGANAQVISLPPAALAVARRYQDALVG